MAITIVANAKRTNLAGCVFRTYDFQNIQLNFYDDKHCECLQFFSLPLPHEKGLKIDTLLYKVDGYKIIFSDLHKLANVNNAPSVCVDYNAVGFDASYVIKRDGKNLDDYGLTKCVYVRRPISRGVWANWDSSQYGYIACPDFMYIGERVLYLVKGQVNTLYVTKKAQPSRFCIKPRSCKDSPPFYTYYWNRDDEYHTNTYLWFHRERACLDTDSVKASLYGKRFICAPDTIEFSNDSVCVISQSFDIAISINDSVCNSVHFFSGSYRYSVDGANVLIYGWDRSMPDKADSLVYQNRVLYHACVTQFAAVAHRRNPSKVYIGAPDYHLSPTAEMKTRAFVQENVNVTDEQVGTTFQRVFMPLNFHSLVNDVFSDSR